MSILAMTPGGDGELPRERLPDWQCPNPQCVNHTKMVFGSKESCPKCGSLPSIPPSNFGELEPLDMELPPPRGGGGGGGKGGDGENDWPCPNVECINHTRLVFGRKTSCPACHTARNAKQPGDWQCPNVQCVNHKNTVFAKNTICPKCHCPRPGTQPQMPVPTRRGEPPRFSAGRAPPRYAAPPMMQHPGDLVSTLQDMLKNPTAAQVVLGALAAAIPQLAGQSVSGSGVQPSPVHHGRPPNPQAGSFNPGDWQCPRPDCINHVRKVFARHEVCPQCGSRKAQQFQPPHSRNERPDDWACPNTGCKNHRNKVFARHQHCPECGQPKPEFDVARSRSPRRR